MTIEAKFKTVLLPCTPAAISDHIGFLELHNRFITLNNDTKKGCTLNERLLLSITFIENTLIVTCNQTVQTHELTLEDKRKLK
jgi:hypothetical protein